MSGGGSEGMRGGGRGERGGVDWNMLCGGRVVCVGMRQCPALNGFGGVHDACIFFLAYRGAGAGGGWRRVRGRAQRGSAAAPAGPRVRAADATPRAASYLNI